MFKEAVSSERLFHFPEKRFYCKASRRCNGFLGSGQYSWRTRREPGAVARSYFLLCFSNKYHQFLWLLRDPSDTSDICERLQQVILGLGFFFFFPSLPSDHAQRRSIALWGWLYWGKGSLFVVSTGDESRDWQAFDSVVLKSSTGDWRWSLDNIRWPLRAAETIGLCGAALLLLR